MTTTTATAATTAPATSKLTDKGWLMTAREARTEARLGASTWGALLAAGFGPAGFKRPGSNRWLYWSEDVKAWLLQNYKPPAA
jgi:hypothetical protein